MNLAKHGHSLLRELGEEVTKCHDFSCVVTVESAGIRTAPASIGEETLTNRPPGPRRVAAHQGSMAELQEIVACASAYYDLETVTSAED
jgi:hypothetical protein